MLSCMLFALAAICSEAAAISSIRLPISSTEVPIRRNASRVCSTTLTPSSAAVTFGEDRRGHIGRVAQLVRALKAVDLLAQRMSAGNARAGYAPTGFGHTLSVRSVIDLPAPAASSSGRSRRGVSVIGDFLRIEILGRGVCVQPLLVFVLELELLVIAGAVVEIVVGVPVGIRDPLLDVAEHPTAP
jgi:hypothetical protein